MPNSFRAVYAEKPGERPAAVLRDLPLTALPPGEVLIEVRYSSLNYKDGLAVAGAGKIMRTYPMVCGIDLAGTVLESSVPEYKRGDPVLANGQGLSETRWGGFSQFARLPASALVPIPHPLDMQQSMVAGTAGFTAMLCVMALEHMGVVPGKREVVVTGAAGGVGSFAVLLLSERGYKVAASTGRPELKPWLEELGASSIVSRSELAAPTPPLASERWAGAVDTVGGQILSNVLASTAAYGAVAACGLAASPELSTTVFPLILRNVSLLGVCSAWTPAVQRREAWTRLAHDLPLSKLDALSREEPLSNIQALAEEILAGKVRGRVVIDVNR
jgi:acrylyl-CoA reductase (NADPH)